jgi:hypothetical protein
LFDFILIHQCEIIIQKLYFFPLNEYMNSQYFPAFKIFLIQFNVDLNLFQSKYFILSNQFFKKINY